MRTLLATAMLWLLALVLCAPQAVAGDGFERLGHNLVGYQETKNSDDDGARWRISLQRDLVNYEPLHLHLRMGYTQEAVMLVEEQSAPIDKQRFEPQFTAYWQPDGLGPITEVDIGYLHSSNGLDVGSRSWDRLRGGFDADWDFGVAGRDTSMFHVHLNVTVWWAFAVSDDNPDIATTDVLGMFADDWGGYADLDITFVPPNASDDRPTLLLSVHVEAAGGSLLLAWRRNSWQNYWTYLEGFTGLNNMLADYDQYAAQLRGGILLR